MGANNLDFNSTIRKEGEYPKNEARGEFEREEFMKQSRVPDRVESLGEVNRCQNGSVRRLFSFGSRPRLIETELEFGQGATYQDESRPGKWRGDDSIQGEKLGEKESSAQKAWRCRR